MMLCWRPHSFRIFPFTTLSFVVLFREPQKAREWKIRQYSPNTYTQRGQDSAYELQNYIDMTTLTSFAVSLDLTISVVVVVRI